MSEYLGPRDRQWLWLDAANQLRRQSPAHALACEQGFVLTHDQAQMFGVTDPQIRRLVRRGEWTVPRRGVLSVLGSPTEARQVRPNGRSPAIAAAALALVRPEIVVSTESAIAMWELPLLFTPRRPCGTMRSGNGGGQSDANAHAAALADSEIDSWFGVDVTVAASSISRATTGCGPASSPRMPPSTKGSRPRPHFSARFTVRVGGQESVPRVVQSS